MSEVALFGPFGGTRRKPHLITLAHARDAQLPRHSTPATYTAMAGSPLKRARKQGIRVNDSSVIAFPRMLRVGDPIARFPRRYPRRVREAGSVIYARGVGESAIGGPTACGGVAGRSAQVLKA